MSAADATIKKIITLFTEEGYITLGHLRRAVNQASDFADSAQVTAGNEDVLAPMVIDTLTIGDNLSEEPA